VCLFDTNIGLNSQKTFNSADTKIRKGRKAYFSIWPNYSVLSSDQHLIIQYLIGNEKQNDDSMPFGNIFINFGLTERIFPYHQKYYEAK